ncbi:GntR family transcriptional regulator [Bordetella holmesii]|uniref:FCD domain protein n=2 Tax=Bordetella holmesii TaxID=35814 RepID=A0A158M4M0_9BORD|nr:GntR family transcriptional regulator [Bordetella holmesii]AHV91759.1 iron dependent repressor, N-terminal DNA binding domain protein [Bordetella holmesii ATCC 51541]AIT24785.1 iron dependent repressor, N-terminal DNA binding domain protein [Bordetella holmesii 44057]EWM45354.1 iron dependent repressor, N-terminal DNA binding domain protein [Bordetella holmesii 70147]EWM48547.1 iron dependent repressor, N-terminal DNA binding domain protein [Bordetella holmesii 41130]EWM49470.1 iron depende
MSAGAAGIRSRADSVYDTLKQDILDYRLAPGDRFTETELAERLMVSRTPVREALFRLQREGYLEVRHRNGWLVRPLDFETLDHFYDLRLVLEQAAVEGLCRLPGVKNTLQALVDIWLVAGPHRDAAQVASLDEQFHLELVRAAGNPEIARIHREATERIRIVRHLDFTLAERVEKTCEEHAAILQAVLAADAARAMSLLRTHIAASQAEVRKITLHRLYSRRGAPAA